MISLGRITQTSGEWGLVLRSKAFIVRNAVIEDAEKNERNLVIASNFVAEPFEKALLFRMKKSGLSSRIQFAPCNQVFQTLLDQQGMFASNRDGINIVLLRLEDWIGDSDQDTLAQDPLRLLQRNADDLIAAVGAAREISDIPLLVFFFPLTSAMQARSEYRNYLEDLQCRLIADLRSMVGVYPISSSELQQFCPVEDEKDVAAKETGHIPHIGGMYTAAAALLVRNIVALRTDPL